MPLHYTIKFNVIYLIWTNEKATGKITDSCALFDHCYYYSFHYPLSSNNWPMQLIPELVVQICRLGMSCAVPAKAQYTLNDTYAHMASLLLLSPVQISLYKQDSVNPHLSASDLFSQMALLELKILRLGVGHVYHFVTAVQ